MTGKRYDACPCNDCGVDVVKAGEYYLVSDDIWERTLHLTWDDNLCIGCLEARLGRTLCFDDFITWSRNPGGFSNSERYNRRLLGDKGFEQMMKRKRSKR